MKNILLKIAVAVTLVTLGGCLVGWEGEGRGGRGGGYGHEGGRDHDRGRDHDERR